MIRFALRVAGVLETLSLLALLTNLAFIHSQAFAAALGPIHGIIYLVIVILGFLTPIPLKRRLLGLVPGIGGLLVVRASTDMSPDSGPSAGYW